MNDQTATIRKSVWVSSDLAYLHVLACRIRQRSTEAIPLNPVIEPYAVGGRYALLVEVPAVYRNALFLEMIGIERRDGKGKLLSVDPDWDRFWSQTIWNEQENAWATTKPLYNE